MSQLVAAEYDVELNGVQIHYTVRGSGPVLIVIDMLRRYAAQNDIIKMENA